MNAMKIAETLYRVREFCTYTELLFEGQWWIDLLTKIGLIQFHGVANQAHNELVRARNNGLEWDANHFKSKTELHRSFEDPMRTCWTCRNAVRMRPTLKNLIFKKLGFRKYRNAVLLAVD